MNESFAKGNAFISELGQKLAQQFSGVYQEQAVALHHRDTTNRSLATVIETLSAMHTTVASHGQRLLSQIAQQSQVGTDLQ